MHYIFRGTYKGMGTTVAYNWVGVGWSLVVLFDCEFLIQDIGSGARSNKAVPDIPALKSRPSIVSEHH